MKLYPDQIPEWLPYFLRSYFWHGRREEKSIYLTFDDGPTPEVTDFVLEQLRQYQFKATFFCIGDRVQRHQDILDRTIQSGHSVGNHTYHHLNAWKTKTGPYLKNVDQAAQLIKSKLFRPPYGRITPWITSRLKKKGYKIILWDVLSGDFDTNRTADSCYQNLIQNTRNGSVIVFHDSEKSYQKLKIVLPKFLKYVHVKGWECKVLKNA